jgi:hypothetical protein
MTTSSRILAQFRFILASPRWVAPLLIVVGCAPRVAHSEPPVSGAAEQSEAPPAAPTQPGVAAPPASNATAAPGASSSGRPLEDGRGPEPSRALPKLTMRHLGMHIGGESNTDEAKRPWLAAIQRSEEAIFACYRFVQKPLDGGTVGIDLYVGKAGGHPEVRKTRQRIGGDEFDTCIREAFSRIRFAPPERPTVLSYSLRFEMK